MRGCKPDVGANRPIVVRASKDSGKTWGNITIAGPALPNAGTNYPGAFLRDNGTTVVLRYLLSNGSTFATVSKDEGMAQCCSAMRLRLLLYLPTRRVNINSSVPAFTLFR